MDETIQKIIVPIDFSDASRKAAKYAVGLARRLGASVHLIHVMQEHAVFSGALELYAVESPQMHEESYQRSKSELNEIASTLGTAAVPLTTEVRCGSTPDSIADAVIDYGADLVVMSTHGRRGLTHLLLGSVAERVIRTARCPVLAIRGCGQVSVHRPTLESATVAS